MGIHWELLRIVVHLFLRILSVFVHVVSIGEFFFVSVEVVWVILYIYCYGYINIPQFIISIYI